MTPEQFCYWLQGALETRAKGPLDQFTIDVIKDHLNLVFDKKTPAREIAVADEWLKREMEKAQKRTTPLAPPFTPHGIPGTPIWQEGFLPAITC
jgi:hypothetical protein